MTFQQNLVIGVGENPPTVTVTAAALMAAFQKANVDQGSKSFMTFLIIAGHFVNPARFPLPQSFADADLAGPPEELAFFFENNLLKEDTRKALVLLTNAENADQSDLSAFLILTKNHFGSDQVPA